MTIMFNILLYLFAFAATITLGIFLYSLLTESRQKPSGVEKIHQSQQSQGYGFSRYIEGEVYNLRRKYPHPIWEEFDRQQSKEEQRDLLVSLVKLVLVYQHLRDESIIPELIAEAHEQYIQLTKSNGSS